MNNPQKSFSHEINQLVVAGFGMAFFLIFCACELLLFLTEPDHSFFLAKSLGMLGIYLALYILYSLFIVNRIKKLFLPLDKIAYGLIKDQVFIDDGEKDLKALADSLKEQAKQMNDLSKELKDTRQDLDGAFMESKAGKENLKQILLKLSAETEMIRRHSEEINTFAEEISGGLTQSLDAERDLKEKRSMLQERSKILDDQIRDNMRSQSDTETEFKELGGCYTLLDSIYKESEDLMSQIYNEMSALQSTTSQINIYVMNTALDISRAGSITVSALRAMDEIKLMSAEINDKTDSVLLLIIRARNALKLAMDQSGECRSKGRECEDSFDKTGEYLKELGSGVKELTSLGNDIFEDTLKLSACINEVRTKEDRRHEEDTKLLNGIDKLGNYVRELKSADDKE